MKTRLLEMLDKATCGEDLSLYWDEIQIIVRIISGMSEDEILEAYMDISDDSHSDEEISISCEE